MNIGHRLTALTLAASLLLAPAGIIAADLFCKPFLDGKVRQSALDTMLDTALAGHLYRVQPSTSQVDFCIDSTFQHVRGRFRDVEGGIGMKPHSASQGQALLSINTDSISTSNPLVESVIKSSAFIDVDHYPEILFVSTGFEWLVETSGLLKGDLTLHGVTRPVAFNVELSDLQGNRVGNSDEILINITTTINRADFGMDKMASTVSDTVMLCMRVIAKRSNHICLQCHGK